jgi:hypothetical protein
MSSSTRCHQPQRCHQPLREVGDTKTAVRTTLSPTSPTSPTI